MVDFIGIGAQKSATSWLFQCLREHPRIALAQEKELHYFSNDAVYEKGVAWYQAHWEGARPEQLKGEISTSYLSSAEAPGRIKAYAPDAKLIALLRDPVERAESHIRHLLSKHEIPEGLSLEELLALRPDILENGRYATHLARYYALFPREQVLIETYDAVKRDPQKVIDRVDAFLGIERHVPKALALHYNSSAFRATALHGAANKTHAFLTRAPGGKLAIRFIKSLGFTSAKLADVGHRMGGRSESFRFSNQERDSLYARYEKDLEWLAAEGILIV